VDVQALIGIFIGLAVMLWGLAQFFKPLINEVRFKFYVREVRRIWSREIKPGQDIIAATGTDVWWQCFEDGKTPTEAVFE